MTIEKLKDNLVKATPEEGRRLVSVGGKTVAEGCVYAPSSEALAAWSEMDLAEAESFKAQWESDMEAEETGMGTESVEAADGEAGIEGE